MEIPTLDDLLVMPSAQLAKVDLVTMNLACAVGLPGAEDLNISECLATLKSWTKIARQEIQEYRPMYQRAPGRFNFCEGFFQMQVLVTVIKRDLGVSYNLTKNNDEPFETFFASARDLFVHGLLTPPHLGTCASLPVLFTALGEALGYPVKLVSARNHLFIRWTDAKHRFNIEVSNAAGMVSHPDEYYLQGIFQSSPSMIESEEYLKSMNRDKVFAAFLETRTACLRIHQRWQEGIPLLKRCLQISPTSKILQAKLEHFLKKA